MPHDENRIPNRDCIKRHEFWGGRIILAIGSQTRDRFHPHSSRSTGGGVLKVFFGERTEGEVLYALTLPVDNLLLEIELVANT